MNLLDLIFCTNFSGLAVLFGLIVLATTTNESMHFGKFLSFYYLALIHALLLSLFFYFCIDIPSYSNGLVWSYLWKKWRRNNLKWKRVFTKDHSYYKICEVCTKLLKNNIKMSKLEIYILRFTKIDLCSHNIQERICLCCKFLQGHFLLEISTISWFS